MTKSKEYKKESKVLAGRQGGKTRKELSKEDGQDRQRG